MKAQRVKNAVIVPTGAKGGFYPKQLPSPATDRDAWLAEGTESYRIFIRTLLSITDNIVEGKVVHPEGVVIHDGEDPYFVVAADKGTATFSDVANAIAIERGFWLGDAFASGGIARLRPQGDGHHRQGRVGLGPAPFRRARGRRADADRSASSAAATCRATCSATACCCRRRSSWSRRSTTATSSSIPIPIRRRAGPSATRMFALPRSSWADYDPALISKGGGVFPRTAKTIPLTKQVKEALDIDAPTSSSRRR